MADKEKAAKTQKSGGMILALETGNAGGSVALLSNGREIDSWAGASGNRAANDYLAVIARLLEKNDLDGRELETIRVGLGPGSYTGIRAGIALGMGLKAAWQCRLEGVYTLDALIEAGPRPITIAALPVGQTFICWKMFPSVLPANKAVPDPAAPEADLHKAEKEQLIEFVRKEKARRIIAGGQIFQTIAAYLAERSMFDVEVIDAGNNLAVHIGRKKSADGPERLEPLYVADQYQTK